MSHETSSHHYRKIDWRLEISRGRWKGNFTFILIHTSTGTNSHSPGQKLAGCRAHYIKSALSVSLSHPPVCSWPTALDSEHCLIMTTSREHSFFLQVIILNEIKSIAYNSKPKFAHFPSDRSTLNGTCKLHSTSVVICSWHTANSENRSNSPCPAIKSIAHGSWRFPSLHPISGPPFEERQVTRRLVLLVKC